MTARSTTAARRGQSTGPVGHARNGDGGGARGEPRPGPRASGWSIGEPCATTPPPPRRGRPRRPHRRHPRRLHGRRAARRRAGPRPRTRPPAPDASRVPASLQVPLPSPVNRSETGAVPDEILQAAVADAAQETGVDPSAITVTSRRGRDLAERRARVPEAGRDVHPGARPGLPDHARGGRPASWTTTRRRAAPSSCAGPGARAPVVPTLAPSTAGGRPAQAGSLSTSSADGRGGSSNAARSSA